MFSVEERTCLRAELIECARNDGRISAAAITGSASAGREDQWSDIDLAFGIRDANALPEVLADWTARLYNRHGAVHHTDIRAGAWIYRVFLLSSTLQVDLAFVPAADFRPLAPTFRLVFGAAGEGMKFPEPSAADIVGLAWLYALHARTSIARGRLWQAEYMISGVRDHALTLASLRHGLPAAHGRGFDDLPAGVTAPFAASLPRALDVPELSRAFQSVIAGLIHEIRCADPALADRLEQPLRSLGGS